MSGGGNISEGGNVQGKCSDPVCSKTRTNNFKCREKAEGFHFSHSNYGFRNHN